MCVCACACGGEKEGGREGGGCVYARARVRVVGGDLKNFGVNPFSDCLSPKVCAHARGSIQWLPLTSPPLHPAAALIKSTGGSLGLWHLADRERRSGFALAAKWWLSGELSVGTQKPGLPRLKRKEGEKGFLRCKRGGWARGDAGETLPCKGSRGCSRVATNSLASLPREGRGATQTIPPGFSLALSQIPLSRWKVPRGAIAEKFRRRHPQSVGTGTSSEPRF